MKTKLNPNAEIGFTDKSVLLSLSLLVLTASPAFAQSASLAYQGRLTQAGNLVSGPFDMQFKLFDTANVGAGVQRGDTKTLSAVPVANGVFTVNLDFGAAVFDGSPRFLEISVRPGGNTSTYTTLDPRQQVASIPYAIQSLNAATAATALTVASGSAVSSLNNLKDNVTLAAGANVTITPSGNTLTIGSAGTGGSGLWSLNGANAYYTAGSVGIGTDSPTAGYRLDVNGATRLATGGTGGAIQFGTPNGETGMSISGANRADIRFDGSSLKLLAGPLTGSPSAANGITITTNGNVGVGTIVNPATGIRLDVNGQTILRPGGTGGTIQFGTPATETGMTIIGDNRADMRFDGATLKLAAITGKGVPPAENGIAITTAGKVGIGTTTPIAKLHVETAEAGKAAVYGSETGTSSVGVFGNATAASSVGVWARNPTGSAIHADGNATQSRDKGGFVKAMAYINPFLPADRYVVRCYNSQQAGNAVSTAPCGIIVTRTSKGAYSVDFGFDVRERFISVTLRERAEVVTGPIGDAAPNVVFVLVYEPESEGVNFIDAPFFIFVF